MTHPTRRIGTAKSWRTRDSILQAAMRAITERGVGGITISDVASAAGVSRGTVYNYFPTVPAMLEAIATDIQGALNHAIDEANAAIEDPAVRIANAMRHYFCNAQQDPDWGRFLCRFGNTEQSLRLTIQKHAADDVRAGLETKRFSLPTAKLNAFLAMLAGTSLSTIGILSDNLMPQSIAEDVVELMLTVLGVPADEAGAIATRALPPLRRLDKS